MQAPRGVPYSALCACVCVCAFVCVCVVGVREQVCECASVRAVCVREWRGRCRGRARARVCLVLNMYLNIALLLAIIFEGPNKQCSIRGFVVLLETKTFAPTWLAWLVNHHKRDVRAYQYTRRRMI
jgi:hypothetical protein